MFVAAFTYSRLLTQFWGSCAITEVNVSVIESAVLSESPLAPATIWKVEVELTETPVEYAVPVVQAVPDPFVTGVVPFVV